VLPRGSSRRARAGARARVGDRQPHLAVTAFHSHGHRPARRAVLQRVFDQIAKRPVERGFVAAAGPLVSSR